MFLAMSPPYMQTVLMYFNSNNVNVWNDDSIYTIKKMCYYLTTSPHCLIYIQQEWTKFRAARYVSLQAAWHNSEFDG